MRDARCEMRDARCEMRDARCEMRDARCKMRDEMREAHSHSVYTKCIQVQVQVRHAYASALRFGKVLGIRAVVRNCLYGRLDEIASPSASTARHAAIRFRVRDRPPASWACPDEQECEMRRVRGAL